MACRRRYYETGRAVLPALHRSLRLVGAPLVSFMNTYRVYSLVGMVAVAACTDRPKPPTGPSISVPVVTWLELSGPPSVPLGRAVQFTAVSHLSDGTRENVTGRAQWSITEPDVLSMSAPGLFTGTSTGDLSISTALNGQRATIGDVIVVPQGTFRLSGAVREAGIPVEALVRIENRALGRQEVQTVRGEFAVYGVLGETHVTALKSGYADQTTTRVVLAHDRVVLELTPAAPRAEVSGPYRLSVFASNHCSNLPDDVRVRSYDALVEQDGPSLTVTLSGAQFLAESGRTLNRFKGVLEPDRAVFTLAAPAVDFYYYHYGGPDVFEILSPGRNYVMQGTAVVPMPDRLDGTMSGTIRFLTSSRFATASACSADDHRFVFAR